MGNGMDVVIAWLSNNWFFLTLLFGAGCLIVRIDRRLQKLGKDIERQERKRIEGQERNALNSAGVRRNAGCAAQRGV